MADKTPRPGNEADFAAGPDPETMTFEAATSELESLIRTIEAGEIGLEASLAARRRGEALIRRCRGVLDRAEEELMHAESADDQP